jgi:RNA polymerase sigma-70 factor (ECF subfamily)
VKAFHAGARSGRVDFSRSRSPTIDPPSTEFADDDAGLVARARQGDAQAFALLYRRYVDRVYNYAAARLGAREEAEDATQEAFFRALRGLGKCRDDAVFAGWLFGIVRHVVADAHRARRHPTAPLADAPDREDPDPTPEEAAIWAEQRADVSGARARCLTAKERELFDLLTADLTEGELAAALGRRSGAIRTARWRLLRRLRECLGAATKGVSGVAG